MSRARGERAERCRGPSYPARPALLLSAEGDDETEGESELVREEVRRTLSRKSPFLGACRKQDP